MSKTLQERLLDAKSVLDLVHAALGRYPAGLPQEVEKSFRALNARSTVTVSQGAVCSRARRPTCYCCRAWQQPWAAGGAPDVGQAKATAAQQAAFLSPAAEASRWHGTCRLTPGAGPSGSRVVCEEEDAGWTA